MMTFLVVADFVLNARLLSDKHLGKQRVEACQIIKAILDGTGWKNHPITKAWFNYVEGLKYYTNCIIEEWIRRGHDNSIPYFEIGEVVILPWWVNWNRLHQSHRAMLHRKDPFFYLNQFTVEAPYQNYGYIWPTDGIYEKRKLPLKMITAPIPPELIDPVFCEAIIKSGKRLGQSCNILVKDAAKGYNYCKRHRK